MSNELQGAIEAAKAALDKVGEAASSAVAAAPDHAEMMAHGAAAATGVDPVVFRLAIFALACFVGYYVVWSVTPALHTPLMAVTNAISSVIIVGALVASGVNLMEGGSVATQIFGFLAVILAGVNIFGGFLVTERMLAMYKKKD